MTRKETKRKSSADLPMLLGGLIIIVLFSFYSPTPIYSSSCSTCSSPSNATFAKTPFLYVLNVINGTVSMLNPATGSVAENITVGTMYSDPDAIAVTPGFTKIYIANQYAGNYTSSNSAYARLPPGTISVINTTTNKVSSITSGLMQPSAIAISPKGTFAYVLNLNGLVNPLSAISNGTISVINTTTENVIKVITVGLEPPYYNGTWPGIAITPDGSQLYASDCIGGKVSVINTTTESISATIGLGPLCPSAIQINPNGKYAYVLLAHSAIVSVIDTSTNRVLGNIILQGRASYLSLNRNGSDLFIINSTSGSSGSVSVVNTSTDAVTNVITEGINVPCAIGFSQNGEQIFVTNIGPLTLNGTAGTVAVFNATTYQLIKSVPVGPWPVALVTSPDGRSIYVDDYAPGLERATTGAVSVINASTLYVTNTIKVGSSPDALAISGSVQYGCSPS